LINLHCCNGPNNWSTPPGARSDTADAVAVRGVSQSVEGARDRSGTERSEGDNMACALRGKRQAVVSTSFIGEGIDTWRFAYGERALFAGSATGRAARAHNPDLTSDRFFGR
jgi:hypothetical protein